MHVGEVRAWERAITEEDIRRFGEVSGDQGIHHLERDAHGRLMAQGLLTATLPTKIGGDMNYIAREMLFEFLRPVFAGDTIRCEVTITRLQPTDKWTELSADWRCVNQRGKDVLRGRTSGVVRAGE